MPSLLATGEDRAALLERYRSTPSGRDKPSRYFKYDLESLDVDATAAERASGNVTFANVPPRAVVCDLQSAQRDHAELFARAYRAALEPQHKYAFLTLAYGGLGAFVYVPADCAIDEPIVLRYAGGAGESLFPHTVVLAERGARVTVVEELELGATGFACGVSEIVAGDGADVTYAAAQFAPEDARAFSTRVARPARNARISWATAEMGASLAIADVAITIAEPGIEAAIASLFFPTGAQHADVVSTVDHRSGDARSETIVKTAASGAGQARFLGNIRIAAHAQHSNASLRDDSLLLSKRAHVDSIPALEIAANDVKAFHGATVGAIDEEALFYMTSRGITRTEAERMIALGFFEPVIERFPTEALRERLRAALERKVGAA